MNTQKTTIQETTLSNIIQTDYIIWLRNNLKSGDQKIIAEMLSLQYVYVKQILGGNKKKTIKSAKAIQVVQIAEKLILERIQSQLEENQQIMSGIKNRTKPNLKISDL